MKSIFENSKYVLDPHRRIWTRPGYGGISYNDGDEIELRIASVIEQASDITVLSPELRRHCTDWPSLYHLSGTRANILRPFADSLKGDILEIGAGCGAITRYLGECGANILALEGSLRRAAIARSRTSDLENVTVLAESFDSFQCDHKFDVITLIGVLEYANLFTPAENPALAMLKQVCSMLKPEGKLVIAIENQLGLKYFAGAPEDHLGQAMYGIEGRYKKDQPQTFGRKVLGGLLKQAGFVASEFLAPFPDYKLPASILTEKGINNSNFDAAAFAWQSVRRDPQLPPHCHFALELTWPEVFKNGIALDVANSFLIIASPTDQRLYGSDTDVLAYHFSTDRVPLYCKETRFEVTTDKTIEVVYKRVGATNQKGDVDEEQVIDFDCPPTASYTNGKTMSWYFVQIVTQDGWKIEEVGEFLRRYISVLEHFLDQTGLTLSLDSPKVRLPGKFFDLVPQNIIITTDGAPVIIDKEWFFRQDVELGHLLLRGLLWMLGSVTRIGKNLMAETFTRGEFIHSSLAAAGFTLTEKEFSRFIEVESKVQEQVTGRSAREFLAWWPHQPLHQHNHAQALAERDGQIANLNQAIGERDGQISNLNQEIGKCGEQISTLNQAIGERDSHITALHTSSSWRMTRPFRMVSHQVKRVKRVVQLAPPAIQLKGGLRNTLKKGWQIYNKEGMAGIKRGFRIVATYGQVVPSQASGSFDRNDYVEWIRRYDTLTDEVRVQMRERINHMPKQPLISVVMPTYNPKHEWLKQAIDSVRRQIYPHWELCIADDASTDVSVRSVLEAYAELDSRIKVIFREKNGHISAASNSALELATGEWIALLDHDDVLAEHALFFVADAIDKNSQACLVYSDEDKINDTDKRFEPYFKCDWNLDLFYSHNLICHLGVYRAELLREIGGFRVGFEGAQDYDLALRCIERLGPEQIHHIPRVLYHWRAHAESTALSGDTKPYALNAGEKALNEHLSCKGIKAEAELLDFGMYRVRYGLPANQPMVSLIIPTKNGLELIRQCIESIRNKTTYPNYEILIVDNGSDDLEVLNYFKELESDIRIRVLRDDRPFNYSALNNAAVKLARGELTGLVNNDIEVISSDWLSEMASHAMRPGVGAVGAKLWYPNKTLQHGGVVLGVGGVAGHSHKHLHNHRHGYFGRANLIQSFSAVTAACMIIKKSIYEEVGGLNETNLTIAFNDIDFCLRVREAGYRNVWTPYAELYHHESATRGFEDNPEKEARFSKEANYMKQRWADQLMNDPAYSPNLTLNFEDFSLAWPPRVKII